MTHRVTNFWRQNRSLEDLSQEDQENFVRNSGMATAVPMVQKTGTSSDDERVLAEAL